MTMSEDTAEYLMQQAEKLQIAIDALKYIVSKECFIGVPEWDAEFVDAAKVALKKLGVG